MADQGWGRIPGPTGGVATGPTDQGEAAAAPNVVLFPRNHWVDSVEELVPIGLETEGSATPEFGFWDGETTAVHEAVPAAEPRSSTAPPHRAHRIAADRADGAARTATAESRMRRGRRAVAIASLIVLLIAGVATHFLSDASSPTTPVRHAARRHSHQAAQNVAARVTTTKTTLVTVTATVADPTRVRTRPRRRAHQASPSQERQSSLTAPTTVEVTRAPPLTSHEPSSTTSSDRGSACVQSPDSGCLP